MFRRSNSAVVTSHERGVFQPHKVFDDGEPVRHLPMTVVPPPPYSHAISSASPPPAHMPFFSSTHQSSSRTMAAESCNQRRPSAPPQSSGLRRLRHSRPDLLRLRNVIHERQMSLPVSGSLARTGFRDRVTQDEIEGSNESDDDTLSSGLSGYYPPPPEPAPPDFIPSNYRSHQQDLMRSQEEDDGDAAAAATTSSDVPRGILSFHRLFISYPSPFCLTCPARLITCSIELLSSSRSTHPITVDVLFSFAGVTTCLQLLSDASANPIKLFIRLSENCHKAAASALFARKNFCISN